MCSNPVTPIGSNISSTMSTDIPSIVEVIDEPITDTRRTRRQQMRAHQQQNRQLVRSNSIPFLTRLFERPVRRRHLYRSLNQNATNLVRRLSQSRLALNLSRHVASMTTPTTPTAPNIVDTTRFAENTPQEIRVSVASVASVTSGSDDENSTCIQLPRSETPPPPYGDIIETKK